MRVNVAVFASAAGVFGCLTPFKLRSRILLQEKLSPENGVQTTDTGVGLDAYELGVLFLVTTAIFSVFL
jgi:hypothetical protein